MLLRGCRGSGSIGLAASVCVLLAGCCGGRLTSGGGCIDHDGDGYGQSCAAGADCDDQNPFYHVGCPDCAAGEAPGCPCSGAGFSVTCFGADPALIGVGVCRSGMMQCDGRNWGACDDVLPSRDFCGDLLDNDCNGRTDDVDNACGDCDPLCTASTMVFDPTMPPDYGFPPAGVNGLVGDPTRGGLIISSETITAGFVWPANDSDSSVSKIDMDTGEEVGRFYVGYDGVANSSSRTAVDGRGACYVASRAFSAQGTVTKIAALDRDCVDRNGNGVIETSRGPVALARGTDECVLWTAAVGGWNGTPRALAIDAGDEAHPEGYAWVGLWTERRFHKLNPADGTVLATVDLAVSPYGAAIDADGNVWVSGRDINALQSFHVETLAVGPVIGIPCTPYGIAVDGAGRIWLGCWPSALAVRYNPADGSWLTVGLAAGASRGIAVDGTGYVWVATHDNWANGYLVTFRADDGLDARWFDIRGEIPVGVGLDSRGRVWTVNQSSSNTSRVDPVSGFEENFPPGGLPAPPYTYSDFTGFARRTFTAPSGSFTNQYELCTSAVAHWGRVAFDIEVPAGTRVQIQARSASTPAGLGAATAVTLATVPFDASPVDIAAPFAAAGVALERYLEVTVTLYSDSAGSSPALRGLSVQSYCEVVPG